MSVLKRTHLKVDSDLKALDQVLFHFDQLYQPWIPKKDWLQCQLALAEGYTNAVRHAHRTTADLPIEIELSLSRQSLEIRIWDYGPPFDLDVYIKNLEQRQNKQSVGGRGIEILQKIANHLSYTRLDEERNCLLIVKQFSVECNS